MRDVGKQRKCIVAFSDAHLVECVAEPIVQNLDPCGNHPTHQPRAQHATQGKHKGLCYQPGFVMLDVTHA